MGLWFAHAWRMVGEDMEAPVPEQVQKTVGAATLIDNWRRRAENEAHWARPYKCAVYIVVMAFNIS